MHAFFIRSSVADMPNSTSETLLESVPFVPEFHEHWRSGDGRTEVHFWGQGSGLYPQHARTVHDDRGLTFFGGHLIAAQGDVDPHGTAERLHEQALTSSMESMARAWQGQYVVVHASGSRVEILPDPLVNELIFLYHDSKQVIVSNRLTMVRQLVAAETSLDPWRASHLVSWSTIPAGITPFEGIETPRIGSRFTIESGRLSETPRGGHPILTIPSPVEICPDSDSYWNGLAERMGRNLSFIRDLPLWVELGLSGGKDSRLILALALKEGVAQCLDVFTTGIDESPEVRVAAEITSNFGLFHHRRIPRIARDVDIDQLHDEGFARHQWLLEGMHSVWDPHAQAMKTDKITLTGLNGDWFRSSLDHSGKDTSGIADYDEAKRFLKEVVALDPADLLREDWIRKHGRSREAFVEDMKERAVPPQDVAGLFYIMNQSSRRNAATRKASALIAHRLDVLLTNDLLVLAYRLGATSRRQELIHYRLMSELSPWLTELHFAGDSWHEKWWKERGTLKPVPYPKIETAHVRAANWRTYVDDDPQYRQKVRSMLLDRAPGDIVYDVACRQKVEKFFEKARHSNMERMGLYGLVTLALLSDGKVDPFKTRTQKRAPGEFVHAEGDPAIYRIFRGQAKVCGDLNRRKGGPQVKTVAAEQLRRLGVEVQVASGAADDKEKRPRLVGWAGRLSKRARKRSRKRQS